MGVLHPQRESSLSAQLFYKFSVFCRCCVPQAQLPRWQSLAQPGHPCSRGWAEPCSLCTEGQLLREAGSPPRAVANENWSPSEEGTEPSAPLSPVASLFCPGKEGRNIEADQISFSLSVRCGAPPRVARASV